MPDIAAPTADHSGGHSPLHSHVFLGPGHARAERGTWAVIWLCGAMMAIEIVGGLLFGSIALVADGLHMSTHAGALLLAALAYRYARTHATDPRFTFGTGKVGDVAGFTSAIVLAMIAVLIGYEAVHRVFAPVPIHFREAIPIACLGLLVNVASAWLLSSADDHAHAHGHGQVHGHGHGHGHGHAHQHGDGQDEAAEAHRIETAIGPFILTVFEAGVPPRFQVRAAPGGASPSPDLVIETERSGGRRQVFAMTDRGDHLESVDSIPEPHEFTAHVRVGAGHSYPVTFIEHAHAHGNASRDNNLRAAVVHVLADAMVSVLVIVGLLLARTFGWLWMDPLAGIIGALVIASWAYALVRDTGAILLDMTPDRAMAERLRRAIEADGDRLADLHLWRLGPGHLGAIVSVVTAHRHGPEHYHHLLAHFRSVSHLTVEVRQAT